MRKLEILLPIVLGVSLSWPAPCPLAVELLPALAVVVAVAHLLLEGYRWQMIPLYALAVGLAVTAWVGAGRSWEMTTAASLAALGALVVAAALPVLLPVPRIPAPRGPHRVGTRTFELVDESRRERYSGKDEPRRIRIQAWFPSRVRPADRRAPWLPNAVTTARAFAVSQGLPRFFLDHVALTRPPAFMDADIDRSAGRLPVLLFSHGWEGFAAQNTAQALHLASHGYVVVAVEHAYGAIVSVFSDGTVARCDPRILSLDMPRDELEASGRSVLEQWTGDLGFALDFLGSQHAAADSPFAGSLDMDRVGAFGHSNGGGAAIQFAGTDARCRAVFGEDPFLRSVSLEVRERGVAHPSFFMFSQEWADEPESRNNELLDEFLSRTSCSLGVVSVRGTRHYDFSDLPLVSPLARVLGLKGPINGRRVVSIVNEYLLGFFDMTLKGTRSTLVDDAGRYPEVRPMRA